MRAAALAAALAFSACGGAESGRELGPDDLRLSPPAVRSLRRTRVTLPGGGSVVAEVADDPVSRERGLMHRERLPDGEGMLFVFPGEQMLTFWMKNTFIDLDMVFIGADKRVTAVHAEVPRSRAGDPEETVARRSAPGRYVLELPAGAARRLGLEAGDRLDFDAD